MSQLKKNSELDRITQEVVLEVLHLLPNNVYKIVLYGSYARGDFTSESDIDLMILLNCSREEVRNYRRQVSRLASRIGLKYDVEVSLLLRDRETFEKEQDILPFYRNVVREGKPAYLTKNGYGAMVVLSLEQYAALTEEVETKLDEADQAAAAGETRYTAGEVFDRVRERIHGR